MSTPVDDAALDQIFRQGRSYDGFLDKPVSQDQMEAIWDVMKFGPTSANCLPARLVWCVSDEAKAKLASCAIPISADKIKQAPVAVLIGMDMAFYKHLPDLFPNADAQSWFVGNQPMIDATAMRNSTLQGAYFIMAARALGLDTGPMSGFNNAAADEAFFAGSTVKSNFISTLGHGDPEKLVGRSPRPGFLRFNTVL